MMKIIAHWKQSIHFWSVRLNILGVALMSAVLAFPDVALQAWAAVPEDLRSVFPANITPLVSVGIFAMSIFARLVKQPKLQEKIEQQEQAAKE